MVADTAVGGETSPQGEARADSCSGDVRLAAMNLLARREHTVKELVAKLRRRFPDADVVEREVARLTAENLQSDERFAENFVVYRAGLGFGLSHIRQDMRRRGLPDGDISLAVDRAGVDWSAVAEEVYRRKFGDVPADDIRERARRVRYMQYRGFSPTDYQHLE